MERALSTKNYFSRKNLSKVVADLRAQDKRSRRSTDPLIFFTQDICTSFSKHRNKLMSFLWLLIWSASIRQYKSEDRPIVPLEYRLEMIAALASVDYVTWFDETDPRNLLEIIRPDVHVNGSEYGDRCIEAEIVNKHGGKVHIVGRIPGLSTSD